MASDFTGLKVIWPPDGTRPPQHRHDIVFVHGLHHGSITDWKNKDGICWPAEHLSLDLSTARILAFGYDDKLSLRSDGLYEGGVTLKQARDLCFALKAQSRSDRGQVPLTFVGHGTGGIIIRCALCVSHTDPAKFESILRKTKHVMFLDSPQRDLTWRKWTEIAQGSSSVHSKGQWRIWSGALDGSSNIFDNIAPRFNITSISAGSIELPTTFEGGMGTTSTLSYDNALNVPSETRLVFGELDRQTISHLSRGTIDYRQFLGSIRSGMHRIIDDEKHITHIQTWLGRRLDDTNSDMYQKNLGKYHPGTGRWLFEHPKFRSWASSEVLSPILWLTGPEGCGKSVLCALGAERIRQRTGFPAVVYIMFAYDKPRSAYHIAAQLALQLLNHVVEVRGGVTAEVLSIVAEECEDSKKLSRVYDLIKVLISQCVVVHIFLDGLDEVGSVEGPRRRRSAQDTKIEASKEHLHSTFNLLADLANREEGTPVRLWCSSRETETIGRLMRDVKAQQIPIDGKDVVADIARYFDYHLPPIIDKANTNPSGTQLLDYLQKRVGDNFLLASILINDLGAKDLSTERGIQNIIHASPSSITEIYQQRLEEMGNSISPSMLLPWAIVSIIAFAKRPLKLSELREALTISLTSTKDSHTTNLTEDDLLSLKGRTIQRDCTPFIEFTQSRDDKIDGYLRLSHASVFYFLHGLSKGPVSNVEAIVVGPNLIANACLRYLSQTRYDSITWDYFQDHHFLTYAAKYWNQHIDEAMPDPELLQATGAFVHSPQFLTLLRVQSLFLDRQFVHAERANIPKIIDTESTTEHLADKYQSFVKEWSHALRLETSNSSSNAGIEECFWGALGKENFLHTHGLTIEKNSSFLLEMQTSDEKNSDDGTAPTYCFYDKISDDGSRVAVWRMPIQVGGGYVAPTAESSLQVLRESWVIDTDGPVLPASSQETLNIDLTQAQWDSYDTSSDRKFTVIPITDTSLPVAPLDEFAFGDAIRVGHQLFRQERGGIWTLDKNTDKEYWENITIRGPWIVRSRRKQIYRDIVEPKKVITPVAGDADEALEEGKTDNQEHDSEKQQDSNAKAKPAAGSEDETPDTMSESGEADIDTPAAEASEDSDLVEASEPVDTLSSAEEFWMSSPFEVDASRESSDEDFWLSSEPNESSDSDSDDEIDTKSTSTSNSASRRHPRKKNIKMRTQESHKISSVENADADADDEVGAESDVESVSDSDSEEESVSGSEDEDTETSGSEIDDETGSKKKKDNDSKSESEGRPMHQFTWGQYCDLCSTSVVPSNYRESNAKEHNYYQCSTCGRPGSGYDICSGCFDKGVWCKDETHLLSKAVFYFQDRRYFWEDNISQRTAKPLINIVAQCKEPVSETEEEQMVTSTFRYTRRHAAMLHDSQPIIHPKLPLLIYPLEGHILLFGNLRENTYLTHEVPFTAQETAETSGSKCIPVSTALRFSACGKFLHFLRVTARNESALHGPIRLYAAVFTIALSSKDACSGKPRTMPSRHGIDLGPFRRLVHQLPYAVTWTDSYVYLSMSGISLRVIRFPLDTNSTTALGIQGTSNETSVLSDKVLLPQSALSRPVKFFPSGKDRAAKIVLGSLRGDHPQPPIVVVLKSIDPEHWIPAVGKSLERKPYIPRIYDNPMIEESCVDDDLDLVAEKVKADEILTMGPILCGGIRDRLETGFKRHGLYCASCFELGVQLSFLRPPPYLPFIPLDRTFVAEDAKFKISWKVKAATLIEALKAGCQFCVYVACRMFNSIHVHHTIQSIGQHGARCCAEGTATKDTEAVTKVIEMLGRLEWKVKSEEGWIAFDCTPLNQDLGTRSFSKLAISLPGTTMGKKGGVTDFNPVVVMMQGTNEAGETHAITGFIHLDESTYAVPECVLELYCLPDDAAHHTIETQPLTTSRGGDQNIKVVKSWLHDCESNHVFCRQRGNAQVQLPTRLIEIVDADTARLVETAGQTGQYIALSYCWGSEPGNNSMTLKANLSERLESLPRDTLPGAIRDAVTIADRLGMKYIWVDALCMVQDDAQDKNVELGNMSQYYRNSWLTIAASTSSCTTGFIGTTGRCENHPGNTLPRDLVPLNIVALHREKDQAKDGKIYVREETPYRLYEEPINKRAWTLQEGILAPRVLLFGSRVIWFCQHMTRSDGGIEDWSFDEDQMERTRREFQMELSKLDTEVSNTSTEPLRTAGLDEDQNIYDLWHRIVGSYSKRAVSYPQDKLPAISALAAEVSKLTKDEYLAGLWRSNLLRDLLWTTPEPTTHRPDEWRAPTWSWASINDAILYDQLPPKSATALATVSDVATSPISGTVPFGEVQSGRLVIDAPCSWIKFDKGDDPAKTAAPFLRGFGFKIGKNERESLFEMLKTQARPSWKDPEETDEKEKKGYQLPDNITIAFMYGKRDDIVQPTDGDEDSGEKDQHWTMWGLILKHVSGDVSQGDDGILFERVMAFSQVPVGLEGGGLPPARRLHIV